MKYVSAIVTFGPVIFVNAFMVFGEVKPAVAVAALSGVAMAYILNSQLG